MESVFKKPLKIIVKKPLAQNLNVAWSPCGTYFLYGDKEDTIYMVDSRTLKNLRSEALREETNEFAFEPTGKHLLVAHGGGRFSIYRLTFFGETCYKVKMSCGLHLFESNILLVS